MASVTPKEATWREGRRAALAGVILREMEAISWEPISKASVSCLEFLELGQILCFWTSRWQRGGSHTIVLDFSVQAPLSFLDQTFTV